MANCELNTAANTSGVNTYNAKYEADINGLINEFMGYEHILRARAASGKELDKYAIEQYMITRNKLRQRLLNNGQYTGNSTEIARMMIDSLKNHIEKLTNIPAEPSTMWDGVNARRLLSLSKMINRLLSLQETRWGKKLNIWERAFLPVEMFALRVDPFGFISQYIRRASNLLEDSRNAGSEFKSGYNAIIGAYERNLANYLDNKDIITEDDVIDGVETITADGDIVIYKGSHRRADGSVVHKVTNAETGITSQIAGDKIALSTIRDALVKKYSNEFMNDVLHSQARNVVWLGVEDLSENEKKKFDKILNSIDTRRRIAEKNMGLEPDAVEHEMSLGFQNIHKSKTKFGVEVEYVMVKADPNPQTAGFGVERYIAVPINYKGIDGKQVNLLRPGMRRQDVISIVRSAAPDVVQDGWYKAKNYRNYGRSFDRVWDNEKGEKIFKLTDDYLRGWDFDSMSDLRVNVNEEMLSSIHDSGNTSTFWGSIARVRDVYSNMANRIASEAAREQKELNSVFDHESDPEFIYSLARMLNIPYEVTVKGKKKRVHPADVKRRVLRQIGRLYAVNMNVWVDGAGNIFTPNSEFKKMEDGYAPVMYNIPDLIDFMNEGLDNMRGRLFDAEELLAKEPNNRAQQEKVANLKQRIKEMEIARYRIHDNHAKADELEFGEDESRYEAGQEFVSQRNVHTKHRSNWTNPAKRIKDVDVHTRYIDNVMYNIGKNKLMVDMLKTAKNLHKLNAHHTTLEWVLNRTKIAFANPEARAGIGGWDWSFQRMADFMNAVPGLGKNHTAESVQKLIMYTKGIGNSALLGATGAVINRTQIVNNIIPYGLSMWMRTASMLKGDDNTFTKDQVDAIIDYVGTDEVTNILMEMLAHGSDIKFNEVGLLPTPWNIQIPTRVMGDFLSLLRTNRDKYLNEGMPQIDKALARIEYGRIKKARSQLTELVRQRQKEEAVLKNVKGVNRVRVQQRIKQFEREEKRLTREADRRAVRALRENFVDLLMAPEGDGHTQLAEKYKKIVGDVSETRLRRIVGWKLSWWPKGFGEDMFTFTGSERYMRKQAVLMALFTAAKAGSLGEFDPNNKKSLSEHTIRDADGNVRTVMIPNAFKSEKAIRIARNAVSSSMFGMSAVHLGEAFYGMGQQIMLYKAYPLQQMIHDFNVFRNFLDGSVNKQDSLRRLIDAYHQIVDLKRRNITYSLDIKNVDHEAIQAMRFLGSRIAMSIFGTLADIVPILRSFMRTPMTRQFNNMIRGGENPAFAITFRFIANFLMWSMMDDDEFEKGDRLLWDVLRLFLPVFLTLPAAMVEDWFF